MSLKDCSTPDLIEFVENWIKGDRKMEPTYKEAMWLLCGRLHKPMVPETIIEAIETGIFNDEPMLLALIDVQLRDLEDDHVASVMLTKIAYCSSLSDLIRAEAIRTLSERKAPAKHDTLPFLGHCMEPYPTECTIPSPPPVPCQPKEALEASRILERIARNSNLPECFRRTALKKLAETDPECFEQIAQALIQEVA